VTWLRASPDSKMSNTAKDARSVFSGWIPLITQTHLFCRGDKKGDMPLR